jgi:hypothetical protein
MAGPGGNVAGNAAKGLYKLGKDLVKGIAERRELKKLKNAPGAVASRVKNLRDDTEAAKEINQALKYAKRKGIAKGVGIGLGGAAVGNYLSKNEVTVSTKPRKKTVKKKVVKKKPLKKGTARYSF